MREQNRGSTRYSRFGLHRAFAVFGVGLLIVLAAAPAMAFDPEPGPFERTWSRTDMPVKEGVVDRTWMWGPEANSEVIQEDYVEAPGGTRDVQYFDKARMEDNTYRADEPWDVTNGLLVVELMTGNLQVGDNMFEERSPAEVNIAGDSGFDETPTYATFADLMGAPAHPEGQVITATVDGDGNVGDAQSQASFNVTAGVMAPQTGHRTASVFWDLMVSSGTVFQNGKYETDLLFLDPYYATGLPITEAYWSNIMVGGETKWVLTQAFERRVLTFTPDNQTGFQVEAGNVGMHYWTWRYDTASEVGDQVFYAEMSPDQETHQVESSADGDAIFFVNEDDQLAFDLTVNSIANVQAAHIHLGMPGEDGPVVAFVFDGSFSTDASGTGTLSSGVLTDSDLLGPLEGATLANLIAEMEAGNAYVNVHTEQNPDGEIRGQLELISSH
jgi:hypothetical protein